MLPPSKMQPQKQMPAAMTSKGEVADQHPEPRHIVRVQLRAQWLRSELKKNVLRFSLELIFSLSRQIHPPSEFKPFLLRTNRYSTFTAAILTDV